MNCRLILLTGFWLFILSASGFAKEWQNIFPLQTTRAEVIQLLGKPQHEELNESEYFEIDNQTVTIRWIRPDCSGQDSMIKESSIASDVLVYQITVVPKAPLASINFHDASNKAENNSSTSVYKRWISQDVDCIGNKESGFNCSIFDRRQGFGYSSSKIGFTVLYYFPTEDEENAWQETHKVCSPPEK